MQLRNLLLVTAAESLELSESKRVEQAIYDVCVCVMSVMVWWCDSVVVLYCEQADVQMFECVVSSFVNCA